ncbi:MAG: transcription elongation factor GreA [Deltaproteobacteria bacterium]|nr:transcription elongation factor GreA [Deltaproteobacteria bacterium]
MERVPITREGYIKLQEELTRLKKFERPNNIIAISEARAHGDISENAEYEAAKERQSFIEGKIAELETRISYSEIIEPTSGPSVRAIFGCFVTVENLRTNEQKRYKLVGPYESAPEEGRLSISSPIGRSLIGREVGDEIKVKTPGGLQEFEIVGLE